MDTINFFDTEKIYDTLKVIDTVSYSDTIFYITNSEESSCLQILLEIGKVLVPVIAVYIAYRAYKYGKEKDKQAEEKRINDYKKFLLLSLKLLQQGVRHQIELVKEFMNQLNDENLLNAKPTISPEFQTDSIQTVSKIDLNKIFIDESKQDWNSKIQIYSDFNYITRALPNLSTNIKNVMLETIRYGSKSEEKINDLMFRLMDKIIIDNHSFYDRKGDEDFAIYLEELTNSYAEKIKDEMSIHRKYKEIYEPLLNKSLELKVKDASILLNRTQIEYQEYVKHFDYYSNYFKEQIFELETIYSRLDRVIVSLNEKSN